VLRRSASDPIEQRLRRFERRLEDAEDALAASLAPDRIDDIEARVETLAVTAVSHDDLLQVRIDIARLTAEITRVRAELRNELDQVTNALLDVADPRFPRRAAG
jgi:predicted  nucleic acid-binding Zn-ribbon protein